LFCQFSILGAASINSLGRPQTNTDVRQGADWEQTVNHGLGMDSSSQEPVKETTMQRRDLVTFVAGVTVGMGGGTLGAFLACAAGRVLAYRYRDHYGYVDLGQPGSPVALPRVPQATQRSAPGTPPAHDQDLPTAKTAVSGART